MFRVVVPITLGTGGFLSRVSIRVPVFDGLHWGPLFWDLGLRV